MKFSKTTRCFYPADIDYPNLPLDLIDVTKAEFDRAMARNADETLDEIGGALVIVPAPIPTAAEIMVATAIAMTAAVQVHMDSQARALGYDSLLSAISYAEEPAVPRFQADGLAFRAWRSLVWSQCHTLLAQVQAGTLAVPTEAELLAMLPPAPVIQPV